MIPLGASGRVGFGLGVGRKRKASPSAYPAIILADSPTGYWQLNETSGTVAADSSGNGYTGTYTGGFTLGQTGIPGYLAADSVLLDGSSGYINTTLTPFPGVADFSVEAWVKTSSSSLQIAAGAYVGGDNLYVGQNGSSVFNINNVVNIFGASLDDGNWHHIVGSRLSGNSSLYLDGTQTSGGSLTNCHPTSALTLGQLGLSLFFWDGNLAQCAYYDYGLTSAQVVAHYSAGN